MRLYMTSALLCAVGVLAAPSTPHEVNGLAVSEDGKCGGSTGQTCLNSYLGDCCSKTGTCGEGFFFCGLGCQKQFGACIPTYKGKLVSQNGMCGHDVTCKGSKFGDCCGKNNWCGGDAKSCGAGCQEDNGSCNGGWPWSNLVSRADPNPTCPKSNDTIYTSETGNQYKITCSLDHAGNDLKMVWISSNKIADCLSECDATDGCKAIAMSGTACYMKSKVGTPVKSSNVRGAILVGKAANSSSSISSTTSATKSTASSSASLTSSLTVSYSNSSSTTSSSSALPTSTSPTCPAANNTVFIADSGATFLIECFVDYSGGDLKSVNIASNRIADCVNACDATEGCIDISMSGTACYMKKKLGNRMTNKGVRGARKIKDAPKSSSSSSVAPSTTSSSENSTAPSSSSKISSTTSTVFLNSSSDVSSTFSTSSKLVTTNSTTSSTTVSSSMILTTEISTSNITVPIFTGPSSGLSTSATSGAPYGNETSSFASAGPSTPFGTGSSSSSTALVNSTSSVISSSSAITTPIGTGPSSGISSSTTSGAPYGNETTSGLPIGSGVSTSVVTTKTVIVSPIGTGASSGISSSTTSGAPYGNGTTSALPVGPTGTGISSSVVITTTSSALNSTASLTTSYNLTSSIASTILTVSSNSTISAPLTTAPIVTGPSTSLSTSSGKYLNTTSTWDFNNWGGISSGHPVATNTTACSVKPTSTATCVRCEGQPGTDEYCGLTINDDSYAVTPKTCNTVEYSLDLTECEVAPDGVSRKALCINGQFPGPLLEASWGDEVVVHVTNSMTRNGTSIHWHGIRQNYTNEMDGVVGVTQCALRPGQSMTYRWTAESYGFSWYHSHLTLQAYEGLFGPMYIHGPKSAEYDVDAGHLIIGDWSHIPVDDMYNDAQVAGVRTMDTGLINGMNINPLPKDGEPTGQRYTVPTQFVPGKKYLFQLLNSAIQSTYKFYIDGHKFTVIAADFVPIEPYETTVLSINIGQRYEIIVEADQPVGDYFLRFDNQNACATTTNSDDIRGIIHYEGSAGVTPNSTAHTYPRKDNGAGGILGTCEDEPLASLVPVLKKSVSSPHQTVQHDVAVSNSNGINLYRWYLDGTTFQANWGDATLYNIINNDTIPTYSGDLAISTSLGEWVYVIIESAVPLGHPIHLHGHDFYVLGAGYGNYGSGTTLNLDNPPRRDVAFMPGDGPTGQGGHLVIAFFTDNPGVWLMHCHIGWHVAMGFALQFIEGQEQIKDTVTDTCFLNDVCDTWRPWAQEKGIYVDDSGV
ncbi:laccase precursor, partial [Aureobasidium melanogenum]